MKKETWIVVANSSFAKIYKAENNNKLVEITVLEHPESRLQDRELVTSKPGRTNASVGYRRSSMSPQTSPKMQEGIIFAREINHFLEAAVEKENVGRLYLTASPAFLGILRQTISALIDKMVVGEIDHDMTHLKPDDIRSHLPLVL